MGNGEIIVSLSVNSKMIRQKQNNINKYKKAARLRAAPLHFSYFIYAIAATSHSRS